MKLVRQGDKREGPPSIESQRNDEPEPTDLDAVMKGFDVPQSLKWVQAGGIRGRSLGWFGVMHEADKLRSSTRQ